MLPCCFPRASPREARLARSENKPMPKITKRTVDALRPNPGGADVFLWDEGDGADSGEGGQ